MSATQAIMYPQEESSASIIIEGDQSIPELLHRSERKDQELPLMSARDSSSAQIAQDNNGRMILAQDDSSGMVVRYDDMLSDGVGGGIRSRNGGDHMTSNNYTWERHLASLMQIAVLTFLVCYALSSLQEILIPFVVALFLLQLFELPSFYLVMGRNIFLEKSKAWRCWETCVGRAIKRSFLVFTDILVIFICLAIILLVCFLVGYGLAAFFDKKTFQKYYHSPRVTEIIDLLAKSGIKITPDDIIKKIEDPIVQFVGGLLHFLETGFLTLMMMSFLLLGTLRQYHPKLPRNIGLLEEIAAEIQQDMDDLASVSSFTPQRMTPQRMTPRMGQARMGQARMGQGENNRMDLRAESTIDNRSVSLGNSPIDHSQSTSVRHHQTIQSGQQQNANLGTMWRGLVNAIGNRIAPTSEIRRDPSNARAQSSDATLGRGSSNNKTHTNDPRNVHSTLSSSQESSIYSQQDVSLRDISIDTQDSGSSSGENTRMNASGSTMATSCRTSPTRGSIINSVSPTHGKKVTPILMFQGNSIGSNASMKQPLIIPAVEESDRDFNAAALKGQKIISPVSETGGSGKPNSKLTTSADSNTKNKSESKKNGTSSGSKEGNNTVGGNEKRSSGQLQLNIGDSSINRKGRNSNDSTNSIPIYSGRNSNGACCSGGDLALESAFHDGHVLSSPTLNTGALRDGHLNYHAQGDLCNDNVDFTSKVKSTVQMYILLKTCMSVLLALMIGSVLLIIDVDFWFIFTILAFLLNYIPTVGGAISIIAPLIVTILDPNKTVTDIVIVFCAPGLSHIFVGNMVEPYIFGSSFELHPIIILFCLVLWSSLWGVVGAVLSVPLTCCFKLGLQPYIWRHPYALIIFHLMEFSLPTQEEIYIVEKNMELGYDYNNIGNYNRGYDYNI